jgi:hypothetical protein
MPTVLTGNVRTDQVLAAKVPVFMRETIDVLDSERAFFEYLSRQFKKMQGIESMKYDFMEMRSYPKTMTCDEISAAAATTVSVDHPEYAHTDQLIFNTRTKEFYLMNEAIGGVASAGKITVLNQQAGSGGITTATAVGDILQIGPEAHAEGEAIPAAYSNKAETRSTYLFQHDKRRANTDIQAKTKEYGIKQLLLDRKQFWVDEMQALAMLLYTGKQVREVASASGPRRHSMSGLMEQITTNVIDFDSVPGAMTLASVGEILRKTMNHSASSTTKVGVCGQNSWGGISAMPASAVRTTVNETSWGKKLNTLITPYGTLSIGYDNLLSEEYGMSDKFFVLDPNYIERLYMTGLETHLILNIQANDDIHNQVDVITGTDGIRVGLEELHAYAENVG